MNTPTTCMICLKVFPIDDMVRDQEGNWWCDDCRNGMFAAALSILSKSALPREKPQKQDKPNNS